MSSSTRTTTSMPAPATVTSSASWRPTTSRWKCSPISAASRWAWHSTARRTSTSASAAWGSTRRPGRQVEKATDETNRSALFGERRQPAAARRRPRHHRRRTRSSSPRRPSATRWTNGRSTGWRPRQRPHHLLRHEHRRHAHRAAGPAVSRTASAWPATASRSCSPRPGDARSSATGSTARRRETWKR